MKKTLAFLLFLLVIETTITAQVKLKNSGWTFREKTQSKSYPAKVPGSIYTDLYRNRLIPDPFFGNNEARLQWVEQKSWVYETSFSLSPEELRAKKIQLRFEGIDTYARIFLNDELLGETRDMFLTYSFDISSKAQAENQLRVVIMPPLFLAPLQDSIRYPGGPQAHIRKAAFQFGWDWAPRFAAGGIWKNVYLDFDNAEPEITDVYFQLNELDSLSADYFVNISFRNLTEGQYTFIIEDKAQEVSSVLNDIAINAEDSLFVFMLQIDQPKLWWPNGAGEPFLYNFDIRIVQNREVIARYRQKVGVREIELVNQADQYGTSFYFKVNGKPVFMKGANYVPQDMFPGNENEKKYNSRSLIEDVARSNMNMIRIWGGGIYESDDFYDLCDSAGILVWQDFMFANTVYPADRTFLDLVKREAEYQVQRLRKHPSIALWCGNNEISEAWHNWGWQKQLGYSAADSAFLWNNYHYMFDSLLPAVVQQYAPGTSYWPGSPEYGRGNPKSFSNGDLHYWGVWHDGHSFDSLENKTGRFMSEFGFQSYPCLSTIDKMCNSKAGLANADLQNHQKHSRGNSIIHTYMMEEYGVIPKELSAFVYLSQILQSNGVSKGLKAQRRNQPFCMGSLYWQLNDAWPAISWSGIDYYGNWKPLQYAVRRVYQAQLVTHKLLGDSCLIYTISDKRDPEEAHLRIRVMDFYGISTFDSTLSISQNQTSKMQYALYTGNISATSQFIILEYLNSRDSLLSRELVFLTKAKNLKLPKTAPKISQRYKYRDGLLLIEMESQTLIRNLWIERADGKSARFSENNIDLIPGEQKTIYLKTEEKDARLIWWTLNSMY